MLIYCKFLNRIRNTTPTLLLCLSALILHAQPASITLLFAGDIMGHEPQINAAEIIPDKKYDYNPCFEFIAPIIKKADLAVANLELTLPGKPPYTGYPTFKSPDTLASAIRNAGFDLLLTANNHSNDAGLPGIINTLKTLENNGFYYTGSFANATEKSAYYPLIVYKNDFKLAFLNYTYSTNGIPTKEPSIVNLIDTNSIQQDLTAAKAMNPDFIIVVMHWGNEYQTTEHPAQRDLARKMSAWGADLIIGAHPHVVQPVKKENDITWTAYSLGNFISNQRKPNTDGGIIIEVTLTKQHAQTQLTNIQYIPTWVWLQPRPDGKKHYRILPVSAFETPNPNLPQLSDTDRYAMKKHAESIRKLLRIPERRIPASLILPQ
jgi:poly-gamma-glutamate synthesis protein (capsule biosynthesis protein)